MTAFIIGNGLSRKSLDLDQLKTLGRVYGCNALFRTFLPHVLVATDQAIAEHIQNSGYALQNEFYTRRPVVNLGGRVVPRQYFGYSSGPIAAALAAEHKQDPIYLLGFDMGPDSNGEFNNVYAGTEFYKAQGSKPTYTGNWTRQLIRITNDYPRNTFIRVHGALTAEVPEFQTVSNLERMDIAEFLTLINTPKDI